MCRTEGRCLVSLDLDFAHPLRFPPGEYAGIVVLRLPNRPGPGDLHRVAVTLIARLVEADPTGRLWIVEAGRVREYQAPDRTE